MMLYRDQRGDTVIIVMALILVILLAFIGIKFADSTKKAPASKDTSQSASADDSTAQLEGGTSKQPSTITVKARNVTRKNDASRLMRATAEFILNNTGYSPTSYARGELLGGSYPATAEFDHYKTVRIETSSHEPVTSDELVLVTAATCSSDKGAVESSSRDYAVLFGMEQNGGKFTPECMKF